VDLVSYVKIDAAAQLAAWKLV